MLVLLKPNLAENSTKLASILTPWNKRLLNRQIVRLMELFRKPNDGRVLIREKGLFLRRLLFNELLGRLGLAPIAIA